MQAAKALDHQTALSKAKIALMRTPDSVFFTTICFSLKHRFDDNVSTACTNGTEIVLGTKFFMGLTKEERVFLLLHETMHVAYLHILRAETYKNKARANAAMDYVINLQLVERGFTMPKCGLLDHQYAGMSWEQVYKLLPEEPPSDAFGQDVRAAEGDPAQQQQLEADIQDIVVRASIQSKMAGDKPGTIPGDIQIYLNGLLNPKLPWHRILQKFLKSFDKSDYSFRKPNRRFFPKYHLPSLWGEKLMDLNIYVDTSGSVSDYDFKVFISEVASILRMMKPNQIVLGQFDTAIKSVDKIKDIKDLMKCKFTGRGGTFINPVLDHIKETRPQCSLIFSDGGFTHYEQTLGHTVIWVIHNNPAWTAPFGKVIHYEVKQ